MADVFLYSIIFIFGLIIGSFLNCVIYRMETKKNLRGRSFCPYCKHQLNWRDLIPILSFFLLGGKCRYCQKKISWQYPLVEFATGLLFIFIFWHLGFGFDLTFEFLILDFIYYLAVACFLIVIFVYDLKHYIIPDKVIYPAIALAAVYRLFEIFRFGNSDLLLNSLVAAFLASGFFLLIVLISRGKWMGAGDIKLTFFMGLFLGWPEILTALFLAFFIGAIIGMGLIAFRKKKLKSEMPFGPFLIIGTLISLFWSEKIINWYLNLITI